LRNEAVDVEPGDAVALNTCHVALRFRPSRSTGRQFVLQPIRRSARLLRSESAE
jgi:hypothetical protein